MESCLRNKFCSHTHTDCRVHMSQTQHIVVQKQIRVMENRLDKSLVRFNSALATNAQLRTMIDHLRQERSVFEGIYKKLQRVK